MKKWTPLAPWIALQPAMRVNQRNVISCHVMSISCQIADGEACRLSKGCHAFLSKTCFRHLRTTPTSYRRPRRAQLDACCSQLHLTCC